MFLFKALHCEEAQKQVTTGSSALAEYYVCLFTNMQLAYIRDFVICSPMTQAFHAAIKAAGSESFLTETARLEAPISLFC